MSANLVKAMTMTGWSDAMPVGSLPRNGFAGDTAVGPVAAALFRIGKFFRAIRGTRRELPPGSGGPGEPPEEEWPQDDDPWNDPPLWMLIMMH
jgi:hypothetical protein